LENQFSPKESTANRRDSSLLNDTSLAGDLEAICDLLSLACLNPNHQEQMDQALVLLVLVLVRVDSRNCHSSFVPLAFALIPFSRSVLAD
jgi:hypothetical protein